MVSYATFKLTCKIILLLPKKNCFQQRNRHILNMLKYYLTDRLRYILILKNPWNSISLVPSEMKIPSGQQRDFLYTNKKYATPVSQDLVLKSCLSGNKVAEPKATFPPTPSKGGNPYLSHSCWNQSFSWAIFYSQNCF